MKDYTKKLRKTIKDFAMYFDINLSKGGCYELTALLAHGEDKYFALGQRYKTEVEAIQAMREYALTNQIQESRVLFQWKKQYYL